MKRRVLSLLLALCLIVGLLPAVTVQHAHAADTVLTEQIKMNGKILTAKTDGTCGYLVNGTTDLTNTNASADNWNVKFEYPVNGTPTLTLKGVKQTSGSGIAGVKNGDVTALNIVIAEDCNIVTSGALLDNSGPYIGDITITSIGDATLTANSIKGITSKKNLVLNANLTIEVPRYNGGNTQHINTNEAGNITFDGGKYVLTSSSVPGNGTWEGPSNGVIFAQGTGNVVINDGDFTLRSSYSSSTNSGMIRVASGTITINGGRINMQTGYIHAFLAKNGTTINGGDIYAESYGNYIVGNNVSPIKMTGGSLQMKGAGGTGTSTIYSNAQIDLTEYTGCVIKNGTTAESAKVISELKTDNGVVGYVSITPCEHVWGDPVETTVSCSAVAVQKYTCTICGEEKLRISGDATGHTIVTDAAVEATCMNAGLTAGSHCSECSAILVAQETVPAYGHTAGAAVLETARTGCTLGTYHVRIYCTECKWMIDQDRVYNRNTFRNHSFVTHTATAATCGVPGTQDYRTCVLCDLMYKGTTGTDETTYAKMTVAANGHSWDAGTTETSSCGVEVTKYTCSGCGEIRTVATDSASHNVADVEAVPATCAEPGMTAGTKCADCGAVVTGCELVPATPHSWGKWISNGDGTCTTKGTATKTCSGCGDTETADYPLGHTSLQLTSTARVEATCSVAGYESVVVTCADCNGELINATLEIPVKASAHTWVDANCGTPKTCSGCGATEGEATGDHKPGEAVLDEATNELVTSCTVCGKELSRATAECQHPNTAVKTEPIEAATCGKDGSEYKITYCVDCKEELEKVVSPIAATGDHEPAEAVQENIKDSDLNNEGSYDSVVYCSVCGNELSREEDITIPVKTGAVAEIDGFKYATLQEALEAAKAGEIVTLLKDAEITVDAELKAGVTYVIPAGKVLTVSAKVTADATATLNCSGTIVVSGEADISALVYGKTFGACGGKLTVTATGKVAMLNTWEGVWTPVNDDTLGAMLENCESGAEITVGSQNWKLVDTTWTHTNHKEEAVPGKKPTCTETGLTEGAKCSVCGETLKKQEELPALGHKAGEAVRENIKDSDLNNAGSYDSVIYCTVCKAELSRDTVTIPVKTGAVAEVNGIKYATLKEAVAAVADGGTIVLVANETFTKDNLTYNSGSWYDGIYYIGDKSFTIDLGGFTISQDGAVNDYLLNFKNNGTKANVITLKNGTIDAGTAAYSAISTATNSAKQIIINLQDIKVIGNHSGGAVIKIRGGGILNIKEGAVITGKDNYTVVECVGSTVNVYKGAKLYQNGKTSPWGCLVGVSNGGVANIYGGEGISAKGCFMAMTTGGRIHVYDGEWTANTNGAYANDNDAVLVAQNDKATYPGIGNSEIYVTGGTLKGGYNCYGNAEGDAVIVISGGNFTSDPSAYVAAGYHAVDTEGVYVIGAHTAGEAVQENIQDSDLNNAGSYDSVVYCTVCKAELSRDTVEIPVKTGAVAEVNGLKYATLQEAVNVGGEIKLLADIKLESAIIIESGKTVILDLNGKTVSMQDASNAGAYAIKNSGNLTIKDSVGGGKITFVSTTPSVGGSYPAYSTSTIGNAGNLTIDGGKIENTTVGGASYAIDNIWYSQDTSLTINDGNISAVKIAVRQVPYSATYKNVVTITGGTLSGETAGLQLHHTSATANLAEVNISGGIFNGSYAFYTYYHSAEASAKTEINISGGTFNGYLFLYNGNAGSADYVFDATVSGGTFNNYVYIYAMDANDEYAYQPAISGGIFATEVYEVMCAEGYIPVDNGDGTYTVRKGEWVAQVGNKKFETLQAAIDEADEGATITLIGEAAGDVTVAEGKDIILDLNGNDIVGSLAGITNNGKLTINDSVGTGNVYTTDVSAQGRATLVNNGTLIINGGWFGDSNNDTTDRNGINRGNALKNFGEATINGGYFTNVSNQFIDTNAYAYAINTLSGGTTIINNATVYGDINGVIFSDGETVIYDGSFTLGRPNEENNLWYLAYGNVEIKGGVWTRAFKVPSWNTGNPTFEGTVKVSGGVFNVAILEKYCAEGYIPVDNGDGTYGVKVGKFVAQVGDTKYESLDAAIAAGGEVKLLANVEIKTSIKITNTVIVDLNGYTLTGPDDGKANWYAFIVDGGDLTLKDSTGNGQLYAKCYGVETKSGTFTLDGAKIVATKNKTVGTAIVNYGGTVIIKSGTAVGANDAVYTGGYFSDAATNILGGTIEGTVTVENWEAKDFTETVTSVSNTYATLEDYKWVEQDGVYVLTAKTYVAQVGDDKFESLQAAIDAAKANETVELLDNVTVAATAYGSNFRGIVIGNGITLDGNGYTLTVTGADAGGMNCAVYIDGHANIIDLTINGGNRALLSNYIDGDITLTNVVLNPNGNYGLNVTMADNANEYALTLTGCTLNGWNSYDDVFGTVTFNGCAFGWNVSNTYATLKPQCNTVLNGCTFAEGFTLDMSAMLAGQTLSKVDTELAAPEGYCWNADGVLGVHSYDAVTTDPTCTENGYTTYTCGCGNSYTEVDEGSALGHSFTKYVNVDGVETAKCDRGCGATDTLSLSISIDNNGRVTVTGDSANVDRVYIYYIGSETYTGKTGEIDWYSAPENALLALSMTEANKAYNGPSGYYTIDKNDDVLGEYMLNAEALGNYVFRVKSAGKSFMITRYVGEIIPLHKHSYESVVTDPTCTENGYTTYTCGCGNSYTEVDEGSALGHSFTKYVAVDGVETAKCDRGCGATDTLSLSISIDNNGRVTVTGDSANVDRVYIYYIGSETYTGKTGEIDWYSAPENALLALSMTEANKAYNGPSGYYTIDKNGNVLGGYMLNAEALGNYVFRVKSAEKSFIITRYVEEITPVQAPVFDEFEVLVDEYGNISLSGNTDNVYRTYIYYIGDETYTGKTGMFGWWSEADEAELTALSLADANKAYNGIRGYYTHDEEAAHTLEALGNYVIRVRLDDTNSVVFTLNITEEFETPNESAFEEFAVNVSEEGCVTITGDNADAVNRVYIYYIGSETYTGKTGEIDWYSTPENALLALSMTEANKDYNGPSGYYTIDKDGEALGEYTLNAEALGNYVFRVRYVDENSATKNVMFTAYFAGVQG